MSESEENANPQTLDPPITEAIAEAIEEIPDVAAAEGAKAPGDAATSHLRFQAEKLQLEITRLSDENDALRDVHELRKEYIPKLFILTVVWLGFVVFLLLMVAQGARTFYLSDSVLIALITSTTVNVIGIFLIAARWLFPKK